MYFQKWSFYKHYNNTDRSKPVLIEFVCYHKNNYIKDYEEWDFDEASGDPLYRSKIFEDRYGGSLLNRYQYYDSCDMMSETSSDFNPASVEYLEILDKHKLDPKDIKEQDLFKKKNYAKMHKNKF